MRELLRFDAAEVTSDDILAGLDTDGGVILENALGLPQVDAILRELDPYIDGTRPFDDDFVVPVGRRKRRRLRDAHSETLSVSSFFYRWR